MYFRTIFFSLFLCVALFSQESNKIIDKQNDKNIFDVTEENYQFFLAKKEYSIIYFYSKNIVESIKMKDIIDKIELNELKDNYVILKINTDTNSGLKRTFNSYFLPSIVVLKNKRVIYGITGYIDEKTFLEGLILSGIKTNEF